MGNSPVIEKGSKAFASLKLSAQKITDFRGGNDEWTKWKSRTECAFSGSGYEKILEDRDYASEHPEQNKIVWAQLMVATTDGTAQHLIKAQEETKNGHAAWQSLLDWYDGEIIKNETAETLREKIETLRLRGGSSASKYINNFLLWTQELDKLDGESYSPSHKIQIFLKHVDDEDFMPTVNYLKNSQPTLMECIQAIRKADRDIQMKRASKRKLQTKVRRVDHYKDHPDSGSDDSDDTEVWTPPTKKRRIRRFTGTLETTEKGLISVPRKEWFNEMSDEQRSFVQQYNAKVKHEEPTDGLERPEGIKIKRIHRVGINYKEKPYMSTRNDDKAPTGILQKTGKKDVKDSSKKRIHFGLQETPEDEL